MSVKYTITVDDDDREQAPDRPWTATLLDGEGEMAVPSAGLGATPAEAVADLLTEWHASNRGL